MNSHQYIGYIISLNQKLKQLEYHARKAQEMVEIFGVVPKPEEYVTIFDQIHVYTNSPYVEGVSLPRAPKRKYTLATHQIATSAEQTSDKFRSRISWRYVMGKVGGYENKKSAIMEIYNEHNPTDKILISPMNDLTIVGNETVAKEFLPLLASKINEKAEMQGSAFQAKVKEEGEHMVLLISTSEVGTKTNFHIRDIGGNIAKNLGLSRVEKPENYVAGKNAWFTIDGEDRYIETNNFQLNDDFGTIFLKAEHTEEVTLDFNFDAQKVSKELTEFFLELKTFNDFVKENKEYFRSDIVYFLDALIGLNKNDLKKAGIEMNKNYEISIVHDDFTHVLLHQFDFFEYIFLNEGTGLLWKVFAFTENILQRPFGSYAKEEYNPYINFNKKTTSKIVRHTNPGPIYETDM